MMRRLWPLLLLLWTLPAQALAPEELLADPALQARAEALYSELRCVVCQNESIASSEADIARDLRTIVREKLLAGESDQAILDFMVARYGDFVLLRPPFKATTLLLWLAPPTLLLLALAGLWRARRQQAQRAEAAPLTAAEQARVAELLRDPS